MASTKPSLPSTKEICNYVRLCHLLVHVGTCVLRGIFDRVCPPQNLYIVLTDPPNHATLQTLRKRRVLNNTQWGKLYPAFKSSVSSRDFDSSLLLLLLRNIFGVTFLTSGWNNIPPGLDTSPEADITRLKFLREIVHSHASVASVDNLTFSLYWSNIKDTFLRIGGMSYENVINDLALCCIDADLEEHYRDLLREWLKDEDCIAHKFHEDETVKKARKEEDMEGVIDITEQNSGMQETEIKSTKNGSVEKAKVSPPELSVRIPKMCDLPETSFAWSNVELPVHILLLTVEDCEFLSCFAFLKEPFKIWRKSIGHVYFGYMGDDLEKRMKIALMRCSKGSDVPGGSLSAAKDAISLLRPKATFSVGACSGLNSREVKLGDVVVSAKLITAAHKTPPSRDMGKLIKHVADGWKAPLQKINADEYNAKVHCDGVFLSILDANKDIIGQHPEAIAVEMEGGGVFAAAHDFKTEWVVVKGIKDFVDDKQSSSQEWKQIASVMAASVVANILNDPIIFQDWPHFEADTSESPKQGLPEKPTIKDTECEVDKDFIVNWSEAEANRSSSSIKYRLELRKRPMTGSTEPFLWENIEEPQLKITGLEYDTEYEVKLFAVNKHGDSEPDVRIFKTKSAIGAYTAALKTSIIGQTEFQPKLLASRTIFNLQTDQIFTNLLIQHGRKALIGKDKRYSRSKKLKSYGKLSGTPVKHCYEIFLGKSGDQDDPNSILVVGKAGIGKSLFCQKLTRDWANNKLFQAGENIKIPTFKFAFLLTFRQLNLLESNCVTLREFFTLSSVLDHHCNIDEHIFEYIVNHSREVLIILDGYDESSQQSYIAGNSEEQYPNDICCQMPVAALCSKLVKGKLLKEAIVMVTSRPDESDKLGGINFERHVEIAGFSSEQVKEYIEKYFKKNEAMKNAVLEHVMKNEDLVSFAHIPMLCYLLCFEMEFTLTESDNPHDLPASITDIYTKLIDIFELKHCAESEYRRKEIPEQFEHPPVIKSTLEKLSKLAAKLLLEKKATFDEREIEDGFELEEVNKLKGSGLLYCGQPVRTALITTTKHFSFTHLTVQEFLAARWFVKENRIPVKKGSGMIFQFMAGILSSDGNEKLMEELLDSYYMHDHLLKMRCLSEYQDKEFAKTFIRNHRLAFSNPFHGLRFGVLSAVDCIALSFVLDVISELNNEEAGEAQHKFFDKSVAFKRLRLMRPQTLSGMQRVCNSLNNEQCPVSELILENSYLAKEYVDVIKGLVVSKLTTLKLVKNKIAHTSVASLCEALQNPSFKLTTLDLWGNKITDTGVASLCEALQHPSCKLTTLGLNHSEITDTGVASLCEALQHPSCKLTTLNLGGNKITDTGVASLCEALQHPSCKLTTLGLNHNEITDTGVASLCEALQHPSCRLTALNLVSYSISESSKESLQALVQKYRPGFKLFV